jgi:hypothetical protein
MLLTLIKAVFTVGVVAGMATLAWFRVPKKSPPLQAEGRQNLFPTVAGTNLDRQDLEFPRDFDG